MKHMHSTAKGTVVRRGEEDKIILNLDAKFPKEVLDMNASADDRYIYCVTEKSIKIYDTEEKAIIHELKKLGNARTAVSGDGHFLGCACPVRGAVQVTIYDTREGYEEAFKTVCPGEDSTVYPCFSFDSRFMMICNGETQEKVWAIDILNKKCECMYQCEEQTIVTNIDSNEFGILLSICHVGSLAQKSCHVYFETATSKPKIIPFDFQDIKDDFYRRCGERLIFETHWLEKSKALIMYEARGWNEAFQVVDFETIDKITPSVLYEIPYRMNSGIRLSKNRKYAACIASDFREEKRKVEQRAYVFQTHDGQEKLSRLMNTIWNVSFLNEKDELLISGDAAESISFASDVE